jgi:uncharacterized protein
MNERGLRFGCEGESLVGVLSLPPGGASAVGIVIPVGGPQYRAGSHRQFVLLARRLAAAGHAALRFDARGMGDSTGSFPGFEGIGPDIAAAAAALQAEVPGVERIVVWGLCDAASATLMHTAQLPALAGLVMLNPWVRHSDTQAGAEVKQYYAQRLFDRAFWRKLATGHVDVRAAAREVPAKLWRMLRTRLVKSEPQPADYRERMACGALGFAGPQLYLLSGRDQVAAEFGEYCKLHPRLGALWQRAAVQRVEMPTADHTFSSGALRTSVEDATLAWLAVLGPPRQ